MIGVGIVGPQAGELISESVLAIEMGATAEDIAFSIHPHPTLTETIMEAAEGIYGASTHIMKRRSGQGFTKVTTGSLLKLIVPYISYLWVFAFSSSRMQ